MIREEEFYRKQMINGVIYIIGEKEPFSGVINFRYKNGQLKERETFIYGIKEGANIRYYESGQIKESNEFINGKLNGDSIQYYENGQMKESIVFKDDRINGDWVKY